MRRSKCRSLWEDNDLARDRPLSRLRVQRRKLGQRDPTRDLQSEHSAIDQRDELSELLRITPNKHDNRGHLTVSVIRRRHPGGRAHHDSPVANESHQGGEFVRLDGSQVEQEVDLLGDSSAAISTAGNEFIEVVRQYLRVEDVRPVGSKSRIPRPDRPRS